MRVRLDVMLAERGLAESREKAQALVLAGEVLVNGVKARKPGQSVPPGADLQVLQRPLYVGRGGLKLEAAIDRFNIQVAGRICLDVGSSTGGFTDCLLQRGAQKVFAVDVGQGQLAWKLRQDPRVVVMEKTNARYLKPGQLPQPADLAVIDCSFISLRKILPPAVALLKTEGKIVALVKPQFEAGKAEADKGRGVIRDASIHGRILEELQQFAEEINLGWRGSVESPLEGPAGNKEFLVLIEKSKR
jgi:23S rRNA (cytidine1920-2'-O)/16S rRNA (cytidine1409-2'-O)-methyltransferase